MPLNADYSPVPRQETIHLLNAAVIYYSSRSFSIHLALARAPSTLKKEYSLHGFLSTIDDSDPNILYRPFPRTKTAIHVYPAPNSLTIPTVINISTSASHHHVKTDFPETQYLRPTSSSVGRTPHTQGLQEQILESLQGFRPCLSKVSQWSQQVRWRSYLD